jgi:hypothetical protein
VRYFFIARNCRAAAAVALNIIRVLDERAMTLLRPLLEIIFQIRVRGCAAPARTITSAAAVRICDLRIEASCWLARTTSARAPSERRSIGRAGLTQVVMMIGIIATAVCEGDYTPGELYFG